jgi:hypothetical protein
MENEQQQKKAQIDHFFRKLSKNMTMIARKHDNRKILNRKKWSRAKEERELPSHNAYNNDDDHDNEE